MSIARTLRLGFCAVAFGFALAAAAQTAAFSPPRLSDGTTPDFRGIWRSRGTAYVIL